jgi:AraC-like DNA-binding protein
MPPSTEWLDGPRTCLDARRFGEGGSAVIGRPALADYPAGAELPTRVIDDLELVWMVRGRARLRTGAGDRPLGPGDLALIPPGVPHGFAWDERRPSRHGYVHFGAAVLSGPPLAAPLVVSMTDHDPLAGAAAYLLWLGGDEPSGWQGRVADTLQFVLDVMLTGPLPPTGAPDEPPPELAAAVDHLRRAWAQMPLDRIAVGDLATAGHVSRGHLGRLFRLAFGLAPAAALERVRCSRAETLLARTDLPVEAVAHQCGFADLSHLSHRFSALHGVSPRGYRAAGGGPSVLDDPGVRRLARLIWEP